MATCTLKTNLEKMRHEMKEFTLITAVKIIIDEEDTYSNVGLSRLELSEFQTEQVDINCLPRHSNLSAVSGRYHVISSRKAVKSLAPYEIEFCKQFTKYKDYCLEVLCSGVLTDVCSNMRLSDLSSERAVCLSKRSADGRKLIYEAGGIVLNGTDLLSMVRIVQNCIILFRGETCGFKAVEGEIIVGPDQFGLVEMTYEYDL